MSIAHDLLRGAIDFHLHAEPDIIPRRMDVLDLAAAARDAGMGGIVLKGHYSPTADRAQIVQKLFPEIGVFGGVVLNLPACGGLNVGAVRTALGMGGKVVWLPTSSAANFIACVTRMMPGHLGAKALAFPLKPVPVVDENGAVRSELLEILPLVAQANAILATGHLSVPEIKAVVDAALAAGVRKILVNDPENWHVGMSVEDQIELASRGVMMERCISSTTLEAVEGITPKLIADQIRAVGVASTVMATDYGQTVGPLPVDGMLNYIEQMLAFGIRAEDIEVMVKENPRRLLGIGD